MEIAINIPQVAKSETERYSKLWTYRGLAVTLDDTTLTFATDFTNVILKQLVTQMAQAQIAAQQNIPQQATSEVAPLESNLIIEA